MILRPSVDASACVLLDEKAIAQMNDPQELSRGYVAAARTWAWLIDPEQWDSERTKHIRKELTRLLGRDFSSYAELEAWWEKTASTWHGRAQMSCWKSKNRNILFARSHPTTTCDSRMCGFRFQTKTTYLRGFSARHRRKHLRSPQPTPAWPATPRGMSSLYMVTQRLACVV
jgi:hypothetical protein